MLYCPREKGLREAGGAVLAPATDLGAHGYDQPWALFSATGEPVHRFTVEPGVVSFSYDARALEEAGCTHEQSLWSLSPPAMRCIYCFENKAEAEFNREHVIPEGFGRFRGSIVLHRLVCAECNSHFGNTLDRELARRSSEGLERYGWGIKPALEANQFQYGDTVLQVEMPEEDWDGALVHKVPGDRPGETYIELLPQVAFPRVDGNGMKRFTEAQIRRGDWRDDPSIVIAGARLIQILAPGDEPYERLRRLLVEQGIAYQEERQMEPPGAGPGEEVTVRHAFVVTPPMKRALAKIAFNYFASIDRASALLAGFDAVRRYVRWGTEPAYPVVRAVKDTRLGILGDEGKIPVGHYITVETDLHGRAVLAHLSLFHWMTYQVVLAPEVPRTLSSVPSGHFFNVADMTVHRLELRPRHRSRSD